LAVHQILKKVSSVMVHFCCKKKIKVINLVHLSIQPFWRQQWCHHPAQFGFSYNGVNADRSVIFLLNIKSSQLSKPKAKAFGLQKQTVYYDSGSITSQKSDW